MDDTQAMNDFIDYYSMRGNISNQVYGQIKTQMNKRLCDKTWTLMVEQVEEQVDPVRSAINGEMLRVVPWRYNDERTLRLPTEKRSNE